MFPRSGLGSIVTPNTKPSKVNQSNQTREAIYDELILRYTPLTNPQQSRQCCDTVAEPFVLENDGLRFVFVFAKCRGKQESPPTFILSNWKGQKHRKIPFFQDF